MEYEEEREARGHQMLATDQNEEERLEGEAAREMHI